MIRQDRPLSNEEIQVLAPSAFAGQPYHGQSSRYAFVPTIDVIDGMRSAGFEPVRASQSSARLADKKNFTKHMIRFRSQGSQLINVGDSILETVLINSHDGTSAFDLSLGLFRLACSNGLIVADGMVGSIHIRHTGDIIERVIGGSADLLASAPKVREAVNLWKTIDLTAPEQKILAEEAHGLRFDSESSLALAVTPEKLLQPRRSDDNGSDLWSTFNRVQENVMRGGIRGRDSQSRRVRSREVKGIDQSTGLNKALWSLAAKMAELKA
jgi:hypothetical protein